MARTPQRTLNQDFIVTNGDAITGDDATGGNGGPLVLEGGDAAATSGGDAGGVTIRPGVPDGAGARGIVNVTNNGGADTVPVLQLTSQGTNGEDIRLLVGTQDPSGTVSANPGDLYVRHNGANSSLFVNTGASDGNTTWSDLAGGGGATVTGGETGIPYDGAQFYIDVGNPTSYDGADPPTGITDLRGSFSSAGTVSNVTITDGHFNFNGTDSEIDMGTLPTAAENIFDGGGTIEAWIRVESDGGGNAGRIVDTTDSTTEGFIFFVDSEFSDAVQLNLWQYYASNQNSWQTTSRVIPLNQWVHVMAVFDSSSTTNDPVFYVDGVEYSIAEGNLTQTSSAGSGSPASDSGNALFVGNRSDAARAFDGDIDRVIMWDRSLSATEAALVRRSAFVRFDPNLIGIDTSANTKDVVIRGGISSAGDGGGMLVQAGSTEASSGTHTGGDIEIAGGDSSVPSGASAAGMLTLRGGDYLGGASAPGGDVLIRAGDGAAASDLTIRGGEVSSGNNAGLVNIFGADNTGTGTAGSMRIRAGDATAAGSGNDNGGDLAIRSGAQRNGGIPGDLFMRTGGPTEGTASSTGNIYIGTSVAALAAGDPFGTFGGANTDTGDITFTTDTPGSSGNITGSINFITGDALGTSANNPGDFVFTGGSFTANGSFTTGANFTVTCGSGNVTNSGGGGSITLTAGDNTFTGTAGSATAGSVTLVAGDHNATNGSGGLIDIDAGNALGTNGAGGPVAIDAGDGNGTGAGGSVGVTGGTGGATGTGGAVTVDGGPGGSTSGTGGGATVRGGSAQGGGSNGGALTLTGGAADTSGTGGDVSLGGGTTGTTGDGGSVTVFGSGGGSTSGNGGSVTINGGDVNSGTPGAVAITGGDATGSDDGAAVTITGGDSSTGTPGSVELRTTEETASVNVRTQSTFTGTVHEHLTFGDQVSLSPGSNVNLVTLGTIGATGRNMKFEVYVTGVDNGSTGDVNSHRFIQTYFRTAAVTALTAHLSDGQNSGGAANFATDVTYNLFISGNDIILRAFNGSSITTYTANICVWWNRQEGGFTS